MGLFDRFRERPPTPGPPPSGPASPSQRRKSGGTRIERKDFQLHIPFDWVEMPSEKPLEFEFRNTWFKEQLIVTVLLCREPLDETKRQRLAEELVKIRLDALATVLRGQGIHSPVDFRSGSDQIEARCFGRDERQKIRFAFVIRVAAAKVVTVAVTRYFLDDIARPFDVYAGLIFDFLQVKEPGVLRHEPEGGA